MPAVIRKPSDRSSLLHPTAVNSILAEVRQLKIEGRDIVSLMRGEPDLSTPPHIVVTWEQLGNIYRRILKAFRPLSRAAIYQYAFIANAALPVPLPRDSRETSAPAL